MSDELVLVPVERTLSELRGVHKECSAGDDGR